MTNSSFLIDTQPLRLSTPEYMSLNNLFPVIKFTDIKLSIILSCCPFIICGICNDGNSESLVKALSILLMFPKKQFCNTVLLTRVTVLYVTFPGLTYLVTAACTS